MRLQTERSTFMGAFPRFFSPPAQRASDLHSGPDSLAQCQPGSGLTLLHSGRFTDHSYKCLVESAALVVRLSPLDVAMLDLTPIALTAAGFRRKVRASPKFEWGCTRQGGYFDDQARFSFRIVPRRSSTFQPHFSLPGPAAADPDGDGIEDCTGPGQTVLVEQGSPMTYLANLADPGIGFSWPGPFDDSTWQVGTYGVGYEASTGAENLIDTVVPIGTYSIYTRALFTIDDVSLVMGLYLGADHDDGYAAWINGVGVFHSPELPPGPPEWNTISAPHESSNGVAPDYTPLQDISSIPAFSP